MHRTTTRPAAFLASVALALTGLVAAGGALAPAASGAAPDGPVTIPTAPGAAPAAAAPGTLVFVKNDEVWMSRGDGTGQVQVTTDGWVRRYTSPTMDDNGVIAALRGTDVVRMRTDGTVLSTVDVGTLLPIGVGGIQGTSSVALSPDGSKIAYDQTSWKGMGHSVEVGTRFSASHRWTSAAEQELSRSGPRWVTNSRVVLRAWGTIYLRDLASGSSVEWFEDEQVQPHIDPTCEWGCSAEQWEPEVSRDGSRLVTMRGPTDDPTMIVYRVTGNVRTAVPPVPQVGCMFGSENPDDEFGRPAIGPDNKSLAWQMADGVYVKADLANCGTADVALAIPGGSDPSWSAAAYRAPSKPVPPKPDPKPGDRIALLTAPTVKGTAKVGKKLTARKGSWKPAPTKFTYQWLRNGKAIKKATKATYKVKKADAGKKITVTVTVNRAGFKKATATSKAVVVAAHNLKKPKIKKKPAARVGKTLKVTKGTWRGKAKLSYQWYRGKKKIKGATKAKYKVTKADRGKKLRVKVTAKRTGAPNNAVWTARTKKVR